MLHHFSTSFSCHPSFQSQKITSSSHIHLICHDLSSYSDNFLSQRNLQYPEEVQQQRVGAQMYGRRSGTEEKNLCCAARVSDKSLPPIPAPEKSITSKKIFFCRKAPATGKERERRKNEREKVLLRHVALICSPAANENDELQKDFFPLLLGSASVLANRTAGATLWTSVIFIV